MGPTDKVGKRAGEFIGAREFLFWKKIYIYISLRRRYFVQAPNTTASRSLPARLPSPHHVIKCQPSGRSGSPPPFSHCSRTPPLTLFFFFLPSRGGNPSPESNSPHLPQSLPTSLSIGERDEGTPVSSSRERNWGWETQQWTPRDRALLVSSYHHLPGFLPFRFLFPLRRSCFIAAL